MAKNTDFVSHKKSKQIVDGKPKLPLATDLVEGEIAINFGKDVETLSIKNESGDVVTFSSDNYYTEKKLGSGFTGENSAVTVTDVIEENEEIIAAALTDLAERKLDASAYTPSVELWEASTGENSAVLKNSNNVASGISSVAEGSGTTAGGNYSHSEGQSTSATSYQSHAEGYGTLASGDQSHAEGLGTKATGDYGSHAEGGYTVASGSEAHAEGQQTLASGGNSHAEGLSTSGTGNASHAEGYKTLANADNSHAEGLGTKATTNCSHAEGYYTLASGDSSHAEGNSTIASGYHSHAEGSSTSATSYQAHAEGYYTLASGGQSHAEGQSTSATSYQTHAEGYGTLASGDYSHAEGYGTIASGNYSHAEGQNTTASGSRSHAEGQNTTASDNSSHAEGQSTSATSISSHAEGYLTIASGDYSHAEGQNTTASGTRSHAEGYYTIASGGYSHAEGASTSATSRYSHTEGFGTIASGDYSHAEGYSTIANNQSEHASGQYNISNTGATSSAQTLFSVGNGTADNARHNAFEIRQNGDIYIVDNNGDSIKLQDNLGGGGSITVDQVLDDTTSASTKPVSSKAVYKAVTDNELVWTNAYVTLSGTVSSHTENTEIHVTDADKNKLHTHDNKSLLDAITGNVGTMAYENKTSYYTKSETSGATEISTALGKKSNTGHTHTSNDIKKMTNYTSGSTNTPIQTSDTLNEAIGKLEHSLGGINLIALTQQEYDDLATKNTTTLYIITDN